MFFQIPRVGGCTFVTPTTSSTAVTALPRISKKSSSGPLGFGSLEYILHCHIDRANRHADAFGKPRGNGSPGFLRHFGAVLSGLHGQ